MFLKELMLKCQIEGRNICCYWYFLDKRFKFQSNFCNGCHNILMMSMNYSDIAFLDIHGIHGTDYYIISEINKSEAINLMENVDLSEKKERYKT